MKGQKDTDQQPGAKQIGNNPSDTGTNQQQQGGGARQQGVGDRKGPQHPAASGSHQTLQPHASGHDQVGKSAGRTNSNDDSGNAPHRGG
jgi:hypothetical protein